MIENEIFFRIRRKNNNFRSVVNFPAISTGNNYKADHTRSESPPLIPLSPPFRVWKSYNEIISTAREASASRDNRCPIEGPLKQLVHNGNMLLRDLRGRGGNWVYIKRRGVSLSYGR